MKCNLTIAYRITFCLIDDQQGKMDIDDDDDSSDESEEPQKKKV